MSNNRNNDNHSNDPARWDSPNEPGGLTTSFQNLVAAARQVQQEARPNQPSPLLWRAPPNTPYPPPHLHRPNLRAQRSDAPESNFYPMGGFHYDHSRDYGTRPAPVRLMSNPYRDPLQEACNSITIGSVRHPQSCAPAPTAQYREPLTPAAEVTDRQVTADPHTRARAREMANIRNGHGGTVGDRIQVPISQQDARLLDDRSAQRPQELRPESRHLGVAPAFDASRIRPLYGAPAVASIADTWGQPFFRDGTDARSTGPATTNDCGMEWSPIMRPARSVHPQASYPIPGPSATTHSRAVPARAPFDPIPPRSRRSFMQAVEGMTTLSDHQDSSSHLPNELSQAEATFVGHSSPDYIQATRASNPEFEPMLPHLHRHPLRGPQRSPPKASLRHFARLPAADSTHDEECPICQESYDDKEHIAIRLDNVACDHVFGLKCLQEWVNSRMQNAHRCPSCRQSIKGALANAGQERALREMQFPGAVVRERQYDWYVRSDVAARVRRADGVAVPPPTGEGHVRSDVPHRVDSIAIPPPSNELERHALFLETVRGPYSAAERRRMLDEQSQADSRARVQWLAGVRSQLQDLQARSEASDGPDHVQTREHVREIMTATDAMAQTVTYRPAPVVSDEAVARELTHLQSEFQNLRDPHPGPPLLAPSEYRGHNIAVRYPTISQQEAAYALATRQNEDVFGRIRQRMREAREWEREQEASPLRR